MHPLNSDLLRTFLAIAEAGSVTGGAARIGRSQSATSLQVRQLEDIVGARVFRRHGRGVVLTAAGEKLRPVAQSVTQSLDTVLSELRGGGLKGKLRMGMPDDHSRTELASIVAHFADRHPDVELEVHCAFGEGFDAALRAGDIDLAVCDAPKPYDGDVVLREDHLIWMCRRGSEIAKKPILPIAVFDRACWWRDLALSSAEEAGQKVQVAFSGESAIGVRAAVEAGIAAALLRVSESSPELEPVPHLGARYPTYLVLKRARGAIGPVCDAMCEAIRTAFDAPDYAPKPNK